MTRSPASPFQFTLGSIVILTTGAAIYLGFLKLVGPPGLLFLPSILAFAMMLCGTSRVFGREAFNSAIAVLGLLMFLLSPLLWLLMSPVISWYFGQ